MAIGRRTIKCAGMGGKTSASERREPTAVLKKAGNKIRREESKRVVLG